MANSNNQLLKEIRFDWNKDEICEGLVGSEMCIRDSYISDVLWPEFNEYEFLKAIIDYQSRNRRFGGIESIPNESFEDSQYFS